MALYPGALPVAGTAVSTDTLAAAGHTSLHNTDRDEIRAIATKLGTGAATPTSGVVLRGNGVGTSAWGQVVLTSDVAGVLPVANGGTGVSTSTGSGAVVLGTAPSISNPTITGGGSWAGSPVLSTPTITSFANATHNHLNAAGGGALGNGAATPGIWTNPYCFRASDSGGTTLTDNTIVQINLATEAYDYNGNFAASAYTAPVAGVYHFSGLFTISGATANGVSQLAFIYVDGVVHTIGPRTLAQTDGGSMVTADILLAAGQVVTFRGFQNSDGNEATDTDPGRTWFAGHLVHPI
jgi:hypothetical protein